MTNDPAAAVRSATDAVRAAVAKGIVDAAQDIRARAVKRTPVDTGFLRKSAEVVGDTHPAGKAHYVAVRYSAPYAGHVHNATGKGRGRPRPKPHRGKYWDPAGSQPQFLKKAADEVFPRMETYIKRRVKQVMKNA